MSGTAKGGVTRAVVPCDGAPIPSAWREPGETVVPIRSRGAQRELNLHVDGLGRKVTGRLDRHANDLVRIAAYAFTADQLVSRGGKSDPDRRGWRRELDLVVPVADPDFWAEPPVSTALVDALGFGTEDRWDFAFAPASPEGGQLKLDFDYDDRERLADPSSVALLSGGTDSLCALVEAVAQDGLKPVVVSHRTAAHVAGPQRRLADALPHRFPAWAFPEMSFWIHLRNREAVARTRRTRGFLVAALGAAVAGQIGVPTVLLPDNGYVSVNPPINAQLVGALNSRATHPAFLRLLNHLLELVFPDGVRIENPLEERTRAEALQILADHGCADLLPETRSCAKSRRSERHPHCGVCSQCVDRRFATVAAGMEDYDSAGRYEVEVFTDPLTPGQAKTFAASYVGFAQRVDELGAEALFDEYPELDLCLDPDAPGLMVAAERLAGLLQRHSAEVLGVLETMITRHGQQIARRRLSEGCLLTLAIGPQAAEEGPGEATEPEEDALCEGESLAEASLLARGAGASAPPVERGSSEPPPHRFERQGDYWLVVFRNKKGIYKDSRAMRRLARLLKAPGESLKALDLVAGTSPPSRRVTPDNDASPIVTWQPYDVPVDAILDPASLRHYRTERRRLRGAIAAAEAAGDGQLVDRLRSEFGWVDRQIRQGTGLGGRLRPEESGGVRPSIRPQGHPRLHRRLRGADALPRRPLAPQRDPLR